MLKENGVSLEFINLDEVYYKQKTKKINLIDLDSSSSSTDTAEALEDALRMHFDEDLFDTVSSCTCGKTHMLVNEGLICKHCKDEVVRAFTRPLESQIWITPPRGTRRLISPMWWAQFDDMFSSDTFSLLTWLVDDKYRPSLKNTTSASSLKVIKTIEYLTSLGIERSLSYFSTNFDNIMRDVLTVEGTYFLASLNNRRRELLCNDALSIISKYRECIFTRHLPYPSRLVLVTEQKGRKEFAGKIVGLAIDAVKSIFSIHTSPINLTNRDINSRTVKGIIGFAQFYIEFITKPYSRKPGIARRQCNSTRTQHSGREVIAPMLGAHEADELRGSYGWTLTITKLMVINKLIKRGYTQTECYRLFDKYTLVFDAELYSIMEELIKESPGGGLVFGTIRNPTLARLSTMALRMTSIDPDVNVNAIRISTKCIKGANGDFDGDELQFCLMTSNKQRLLIDPLKPSNGFIDTATPFKIRRTNTLHPEALTNVNSFMASLRG